MELLLVRHAIAEERRSGLPDATRALTSQGRARFAAEVRGLDALKLRLDRVLYSPMVRATQTAALLRPVVSGRLEETALLAGPPGTELLAALRWTGAERVAVVGHEPWLSELASLLLTGGPALAERLPLKKGGVIWLEGEPAPGGMRLRAFLPPRVLRGLGR